MRPELRSQSVLAAIAVLPLMGAAHAAPMRVTVRVDHAYSVNGHTEVQRNLFGLSAYEGAPIPAMAELRQVLTEPGITCLGFPGLIDWCCPPQPPPGGVEALVEWYKSDEAVRMIRDRPLNGDRYMYGKILPACREMGIEPMVYLLGGPPWMTGPEDIPLDNKDYARVVVAYVGLLRKLDPQLRLFHLDNEPNARWYKADRGGPEYAELFTTVAQALHPAFPDARIGGPVLCWPPAWPPAQEGQRNWYTWEGYTLPLIDRAGDQLDFFDFHIYGFTVDQALEEITTLENELRLRRGREVPILITESGLPLTEAEWRDPLAHWEKRTLPWERYLLALLEHPDKVAANQMHDLSAIAGQWFRFMNWDDPVDQTPTYWLYWVMRHVRGTRVVVEQPAGGPVHALASVAGRRAAALLFNNSDAEHPVEVSFRGAAGQLSTRWDRIHVDRTAKRFVHDSGEGAAPVLPPFATAAVYADLPAAPKARPAAERLECFGETVMNEFPLEGGTVSVPVTVPAEAVKGARSARVRVGTLGNAPGERLTMAVGGRTYELQSATYFQEVTLTRVPATGRQAITFACHSTPAVVAERPGEHRLRVSSVTVVIERRVAR